MTELIPADLTVDRLTALIAACELVLRAERKSPQTIKTYLDGLHRYRTWCSLHAAEPMSRTTLNQWIVAMLDAGRAPGTARTRQLAVRRSTAWLIIEGLLPADPFCGVKAPKVDQPDVEPPTDDELRALIAACAAPAVPVGLNIAASAERLPHRRDEAIVRIMFETSIRTGEVVALEVGISTWSTAWSISAVARVSQAESSRSDRPPLRRYACTSISKTGTVSPSQATCGSASAGDAAATTGCRDLRRRAQRAGIEGFHPHKLRHTAAHPLARTRRHRIRVDGHGGLDPHRHARALHPRPSLRTCRARSSSAQPRGSVGVQVDALEDQALPLWRGGCAQLRSDPIRSASASSCSA